MIRLENISFDQCIKCTVCTIYCPVARVTHLFPGPKQSGPDTERLRIKDPELVDASLKYCSNCKRCETACPSGVQIA
ncbi:MAG: 4Fe-4S dicluster domain-containing protein, partial [Chrysiogenales bacterium]